METDFAGRSVGAGYVEGLDAKFVARGYVSENVEGGAWGSSAGDRCGSGVVRLVFPSLFLSLFHCAGGTVVIVIMDLQSKRVDLAFHLYEIRMPLQAPITDKKSHSRIVFISVLKENLQARITQIGAVPV